MVTRSTFIGSASTPPAPRPDRGRLVSQRLPGFGCHTSRAKCVCAPPPLSRWTARRLPHRSDRLASHPRPEPALLRAAAGRGRRLGRPDRAELAAISAEGKAPSRLPRTVPGSGRGARGRALGSGAAFGPAPLRRCLHGNGQAKTPWRAVPLPETPPTPGAAALLPGDLCARGPPGAPVDGPRGARVVAAPGPALPLPRLSGPFGHLALRRRTPGPRPHGRGARDAVLRCRGGRGGPRDHPPLRRGRLDPCPARLGTGHPGRRTPASGRYQGPPAKDGPESPAARSGGVSALAKAASHEAPGRGSPPSPGPPGPPRGGPGRGHLGEGPRRGYLGRGRSQGHRREECRAPSRTAGWPTPGAAPISSRPSPTRPRWPGSGSCGSTSGGPRRPARSATGAPPSPRVGSFVVPTVGTEVIETSSVPGTSPLEAAAPRGHRSSSCTVEPVPCRPGVIGVVSSWTNVDPARHRAALFHRGSRSSEVFYAGGGPGLWPPARIGQRGKRCPKGH